MSHISPLCAAPAPTSVLVTFPTLTVFIFMILNTVFTGSNQGYVSGSLCRSCHAYWCLCSCLTRAEQWTANSQQETQMSILGFDLTLLIFLLWKHFFSCGHSSWFSGVQLSRKSTKAGLGGNFPLYHSSCFLSSFLSFSFTERMESYHLFLF